MLVHLIQRQTTIKLVETMKLPLFRVAYALCLLFSSNGISGTTFYLGGLFPTDAEDPMIRISQGLYPQIAAELAVEDINLNGMLAPYNVSMELKSSASGCCDSASIYAYLNLMESLSSNAG